MTKLIVSFHNFTIVTKKSPNQYKNFYSRAKTYLVRLLTILSLCASIFWSSLQSRFFPHVVIIFLWVNGTSKVEGSTKTQLTTIYIFLIQNGRGWLVRRTRNCWDSSSRTKHLSAGITSWHLANWISACCSPPFYGTVTHRDHFHWSIWWIASSDSVTGLPTLTAHHIA
jgi:hypothetical protein